MSVIDGQDANAATFNAAFASKQADNELVGKQTLSRVSSGDPVEDVQQAINDLIVSDGEKIPLAEKGQPFGVAPLNSTGQVDSAYLPSYVDDVVEVANGASLPVLGETGKIYVTIDDGNTYRWSGSSYVFLGQPIATTDDLTEGTTNFYFTMQRVLDTVLTGLSLVTGTAISAADTVLSALGKLQKQITNHLADLANPHAVTKAQVGLSDVDNTSDVNKPVSTAQQTAIDAKVADSITDGVTNVAPSQNAVFDALATKANSSDGIVNALIFG